MSQPPSAALVLADGTVFRGRSIGAEGLAVGEVVFNTAMTGYQEILTDPSYCRQIVTLTYPHIGNTGVNAEDEESARIHAAALVVRDVPALLSNWRAQESLPAYLARSGVVGIADIDTRKLTRLLREKGAQSGCVIAVGDGSRSTGDRRATNGASGRAIVATDLERALEAADLERALKAARGFAGLAGMDLAKEVSTRTRYEWTEGIWRLGMGHGLPGAGGAARFHVVAYDYGIKRNILRMLVARGARVSVLPAQADAAEALSLKPDGVFLSNGPGDPEPCDYAIKAIRTILDTTRIPVFGICLGHQLMGLASGAKTMKMKFGHHGANHPVKDLDSGVVAITSQNHGFAVDPATLPGNLRTTHVSLFDGSLQGLARTDRPAFCFQGHPEANPGPHDIGYLFDRFAKMMEATQRA